ncbi:Crp/Fnr family transcriptional regulator [Streptomyces sp. NPDC004266]|uniref:Crp/Fnr family transcriptional regulator n=1 Tax=Streptomyces sp. NPDC004266 TaxID=3364693 RepID=UPI0036B6CE0D
MSNPPEPPESIRRKHADTMPTITESFPRIRSVDRLPASLRVAEEARARRLAEASTTAFETVEFRAPRSGTEVRLARYFGMLGVGTTAATAIAAGSFVHLQHAGPLRNPRRSGYVDVVLSGVVAEANRLWGSEWWLGDLDVFRDTPGTVTRPQIDVLGPAWILRIDRDVLRSWAMRDLSVQRMLHQVHAERYRILETVYGVDQRSTLARLAQLLQYLARRRDVLDTARLVPKDDDVLHGPTQKHLADALGLSLASVEKSMSVLRKHGVLASTGKGRANRAYNILRPELLQAAAHGHAFEAPDLRMA